MPNWEKQKAYKTPCAEPLQAQLIPQNFLYRGASMGLVFRPGDYLMVTPILMDAVRIGDVIIFCNRHLIAESNWTVHRVVFRRKDGLVTWGDNNPLPDLYPVTEANLIGVVHSFERNGQRKPVLGGRWGVIYSRFIRGLRGSFWKLKGVGRRPYGWLRHSGLVRRVWQPNLVRMQIETEQGTLVKYVHRRRTVAIWNLQRHTFIVHKPYDLVISPPEKTN